MMITKAKRTSSFFPLANIAQTPTPTTPTYVQPSTAGEAPVTQNAPARGGKFTINGVTIPIDIAMHSVANIVTIINGLGQSAQVVASINRDGSLVVNSSVVNGPDPTFGGDSTLLTALGLQ